MLNFVFCVAWPPIDPGRGGVEDTDRLARLPVEGEPPLPMYMLSRHASDTNLPF